jgi:hypothetical protein
VRKHFLPLALLATLAVLLLTGCGGSSTASAASGGSVPAGAAQVPASVSAFFTLDSSFGDQWQTVNQLLDRFPSKDELVASLQQSLAKSGVDFDKDIKQTIGPELDFALFDDPKAAGVTGVGLTQPKDRAGFEAALEKADDPPVTEELGDWLLISDSQAHIDAFKALTGGKLSDDASFKEAFEALPDGALGRVYANGAALKQRLSGKLGATGGSFRWAAAAAKAVTDGIKVDSIVKTSGGKAENFSSDLLDKVPASAFAVLSFSGKSVGLDEQVAKLRATGGQVGKGVTQFETATGVSLADVAALFNGEGVLYVRAGSPIPEVTLIEDGVDVDKGVTTLTALATRLGGLLHATPQPATVAGAKVMRLVAGPVVITFGNVDGQLVVTTGANAIDDLKGGGSKLTDDDAFKQAQKDAGVSGDTAGLFYVNVADAYSAATALAQIAGQGNTIRPHVDENVKHVESFFTAATADDEDTLRVSSFLRVQ